MTQLQIDMGLMFSAVFKSRGERVDTGFLNRITGEIIFVGHVGEMEAVFGMEAAVNSVFNLARIDSSPDDWLQIPRCNDLSKTDEFVEAFLARHGIEALLY